MESKLKRRVFSNWESIRQRTTKSIPKQFLGIQGRLLLVVNTLFLLAEALSGTFVNIYLWKEGGGFVLIGLYNIAFFIALQLTFMFSGKWVKVYNKITCLRYGILVASSFYLMVLFLDEKAIDYIIALGLLQGIGHGFFWFSFNIILFEITNKENRDKFNGLSGVFGSFVGMAAPLAAGYFISKMADMKGYYTIFSISLGVYIIAAILSVFLKKREADSHFSLKETYNIFKKDGTWRLLFFAMIGQGINEAIFPFLIGILVFVATSDEWKLGIYTFITSGVSFFSFYIAGRLLRTTWRNKSLFWGSALMSLSVLPLYYEVNYSTLIWMGVGVSLFSPLYLIPAVSIVFDTIGKNNGTAKWKVEKIIIRESGLTVGRIIALSVFIALIHWSEEALVLNSIILAVTLAQFITWHFMRKINL